MKYFVLPNLASHETEEIETDHGNLYQLGAEHDKGRRTRVPAHVKEKTDFSRWVKDPDTEYCFYSLVAGTSPNLRVSESNPPRYFYGMIADHDAPHDGTEMATVMKRINPNCPPTFMCKTFSGNIRLVWMFPERMPWCNDQVWKLWCKKFAKEAHVKRLFPALDDASFNAMQYWALGGEWVRLSETLPSMNLLMLWMEQCSRKVKWSHEGTVIPLEAVAEEANLRFPGRWKGPFELGARGCRFWDPTSDNDTGAIIRESGMQCFTGDQPFVPWWQVFDASFVKQFEADRIGKAINEVWFDGDKYWVKAPAGHWVSRTKQDIALHLEVAMDLKPTKDGEETSEMKRALYALQTLRGIDGAVPLPGMPEGIIHYHGSEFLNTIRVRPVAPASGALTMPEIQRGGRFILGLLVRVLGDEQFWHFIAWLKRFYMSHYNRKPLPGQAVLLAGIVAIGKTFISNVIVARLMGGHSDGSDYLMGRTQFNKELMGMPVITVDDAIPANNPGYMSVFTSMMKRVAANHSMQFSAKFRDTYLLPNNSRTIVTCNADPESLRILPDTDQNVLDKVLIFLAQAPEPGTAGFVFPANASEIVNKELPFFARYLLELEIPAQFLCDSRFGVVNYHHPELLATARASNTSHAFKELLDIFLASYFDAHPDETAWEGSSTQLLQEMLLDDSLKEIARAHTPVGIGRSMGQLMGHGLPIHQSRHDRHERHWIIDRKLLNWDPETGA